ncbi:MAG: AAA family ATPase [bacterium]|nr:AAA family ATPase [bacterium]
MRVHRIRLRNYRGVADSEVTFTDDGVTIIEGDNEVGKTSIPEALGMILNVKFPDSSKAGQVLEVCPVHRDAGPEVEVEITTGPHRFVYSKRWHRQPHTRLEVTAPRHEQLTGRQAHERVEEILNETLDRDLWDALRVQQGTEVALPGFDVPSLGRALDAAATGESAGDREDDLWGRIRTEREKYWTRAGRPKADRKEAERGVAEARVTVAQLEGQIADIESDAAEVERRLADRTRLAEVRGAAEREEQTLGVRWQALERLQSDVARLDAEYKAAVAERDRIREDVRRRDELVDGLDGARSGLVERQAEAARSAPLLTAAAARSDEAAEAYESVTAELAEARLAQQRANEDCGHHRRMIEVADLRERHDRVVEAQQALAEAEAHLEAVRVDDELLERIEAANFEVVRAESSATSAAASLVVTALTDLEMSVSGETVELPAGGDHKCSVSDDARITLPGVVQVDVTAGGGSKDKVAELEDAQARLGQLCAEGGVSSFDEARRAAEQRKDTERNRSEAATAIKRDLGDLTLDVLAQKIAGLSRRIDADVAERPADPPLPADFEESKRLVSEADRMLAELEERHSRCRDAAEEAKEEFAKARQDEAVMAAKISSARGAVQDAERSLVAARAERRDADLSGALALAQQVTDDAGRALEQARAAVAEVDPRSLSALLENARAATNRAATELRGNEDSLTALRARLDHQGEAGLHEQLGEAERRLEHLSGDHERTEARARAAQLLFETFERRRAESRRRYLAPFKERIEQFGRIVFGPTFEVELDDDLRVVRRTHNGVTLNIEQLSVGAREQLGVLARLACAASVSPDGGGAPVVLDDALGWSDPGRLARMGAAIAAAGRECQVIVLTCTPGRYSHVGNAEVVSLPA